MALISFGNIMAVASTVGNVASTSVTQAATEFVVQPRSSEIYVQSRNLIDVNTGISRNRAENPKSERWT